MASAEPPSNAASPQLPLLCAVTCVARAEPHIAALSHVLTRISELADHAALLPLDRAAASGACALFHRAAMHTRASGMQQCVVDYWFGRAMDVAARKSDMAMAACIHAHHPARLETKALHIAAGRDDLAMLQWLLLHRVDEVCTSEYQRSAHGSLQCCMQSVYETALQRGHLVILRWLYQSGYTRHMRDAGALAAASGDLETVLALHELNAPRCFSSSAVDEAAAHGHAAIVEFLVDHRGEGFSAHATCSAQIGRHDALAEFLQLRSGGRDDSWGLARAAAEAGRLDILQWDTYAMRDPRHLFSAMTTAALHGHIEVVAWLVTYRHVQCSVRALASAAQSGHLHVLQWVHAHGGGEWTTDVMDRAAQSGHLNVVQWLHENRHEGCSTGAMNAAAACGNLALVQWLHVHRAEGCTTNAMDLAAAYGRLAVVQWLHENRSEGCTVDAMNAAARNGHLDVVMWLHEHRFEGCTHAAMDRAPLPVAQWLHWNRREGCTATAMVNAAKLGNLALLQFLHDHCRLDFPERAVTNATRAGHLGVVVWLYKRFRERFDVEEALKIAAKQDHDHIVVWLQNAAQAAVPEEPPKAF